MLAHNVVPAGDNDGDIQGEMLMAMMMQQQMPTYIYNIEVGHNTCLGHRTIKLIIIQGCSG